MTGDAGSAGDVGQIWSQTLADLLNSGAHIYVLNDAATPQLESTWRSFEAATSGLYFKYDSQPSKNHFDRWGANRIGTSTNNDPALVRSVTSWISALTVADVLSS